MKTNFLCIPLLVCICHHAFSQTYPTFGAEIPVTINGLTFDAMEPSISADGNYIFFNSLNDGIETSLYYATRIDDSTFNYVGSLTGANQTISPRLDAVASSDSADRFYWTSLRDFPTQFDNCFHGSFNGNDIENIGRLHGTFYIYEFGWLMMDAAINYHGDFLYYTNAYFGPTYAGCNGVPCKGQLGVASRQDDSTFNKLSNSDGIMQNINDTNFVVYAPQVSKNGLELYFTRFLKSNISLGTEICVSVRNAVQDDFSLPSVLYPFSTLIPEATTLTSDQLKLYYHKKSGDLYKLFLRYRTSSVGLNETDDASGVKIYPNPSSNFIHVELKNLNTNYTIELHSMLGKQVLKEMNSTVVNLTNFSEGVYVMTIKQGDSIWSSKIVKQ